MACFYVFGGIMHFVSPKFYVKMMPSYIPYPNFWVVFTGVLEILLGIGLFFEQYRSLIALSIIGLLVLVFPANINMALNANKFRKLPPLFLWLRLPLQFVLIWWAYQYVV